MIKFIYFLMLSTITSFRFLGGDIKNIIAIGGGSVSGRDAQYKTHYQGGKLIKTFKSENNDFLKLLF